MMALLQWMARPDGWPRRIQNAQQARQLANGISTSDADGVGESTNLANLVRALSANGPEEWVERQREDGSAERAALPNSAIQNEPVRDQASEHDSHVHAAAQISQRSHDKVWNDHAI